jgi:anti-sigma B factor antagonist
MHSDLGTTQAMTEHLTIDTAEHDAHAWKVNVHGDLDASSAPRLADVLDELVQRDARLVAVDLEGVDFLDSSGLRVLLSASERLAQRNGQLFLQGVSAAVERVLEITGVIERLKRSA